MFCLQLAQRNASSQALATDLTDIVGKENVSTSEAVREQHSHDESYHAYALRARFFSLDHLMFTVVISLM